jgi:hypothetical protein
MAITKMAKRENNFKDILNLKIAENWRGKVECGE